VGKQFKVFHEDYLWLCEASSYEDAAQAYAEYSDSQGDYSILDGYDIKVRVESEGGDSKEFSVSGHREPFYFAHECET
jgi:hypothetical protein